jgi:hypothetical protein
MLPLAKFSWNSTSVLEEMIAGVIAHDCRAPRHKMKGGGTI